MASTQAIAKALIAMQGIQVREITTVMTESFVFALRNVSDSDVERGVGRAIETLRFFPSPGEFREVCGANSAPPIDIDLLCRSIQACGEYHANIGWVDPPVRVVIERFGEAIGAAYAVAGASRIFSDNDTSRDIARREFQAELSQHPREELAKWLASAKPQRALPPAERPPQQLPAIRGPKGPDWTGLKANKTIADVATSLSANKPR